MIAAFRQENGGAILIEPEQLRNVGIVPDATATRGDGLVDIKRLSGVTFTIDEARQTIDFNVPEESRTLRIIQPPQTETLLADPQTSFGALVNYTLFASTGGDRLSGLFDYEGASGLFEGRLFGPYGTLNAGLLVTHTRDRKDLVRLDTTWSYSDQRRMLTYRVGDVITGGLGWTRPVRLGGLQLQRNFALRPDLVTFPLPELVGTAAVPSTVELFVNNARHLSQDVHAGPFAIRNIPIVTGSGNARIVVRDALGRETVSEVPFFASSDLLAEGLSDFSVETGFTRRFFGIRSNDYDTRPMAVGTFRYGVNNGLTVEAHVEGGESLFNGGAGAAFSIGSIGVGSLAGAASTSDRGSGGLVAASVELRRWNLSLFARTQRTFGDYDDIASVTAEDYFLPGVPGPAPAPGPISGAEPPRALDQVSLSVPLPFDPATFNLTYTQLKIRGGPRSRIGSVSINRTLGGNASLFASGFADFDDSGSWGAFAGVSFPLGGDVHASAGVDGGAEGWSASAEAYRSERPEIGSVGWRVRANEGAISRYGAEVSYRAPFARLSASLEKSGDAFRATAQADGAIVIAGGGVFASDRIDDAFAIVDAGAPGVGVSYENNLIGVTGSGGKLLLPRLRSYQRNRIAIDLADLPIDAAAAETSKVAIPADRSGTIVRFDVDAEPRAALVSLVNTNGEPLPTGSTARIDGTPGEFIVGYDGQAWLTGLSSANRVLVEVPHGKSCIAEFTYRPQPGEQVRIDATCRAIQ